MLPLLSRCTLMSKKFTVVGEISISNLIDGRQLLRYALKSCSSASPCVHMTKMSSMKLTHMWGCLWYVSTYMFSNQPINVLAKERERELYRSILPMGGSHIYEIRTTLQMSMTLLLRRVPYFARLPLMSLLIYETAVSGQQ